jgi:hypothetical protein
MSIVVVGAKPSEGGVAPANESVGAGSLIEGAPKPLAVGSAVGAAVGSSGVLVAAAASAGCASGLTGSASVSAGGEIDSATGSTAVLDSPSAGLEEHPVHAAKEITKIERKTTCWLSFKFECFIILV